MTQSLRSRIEDGRYTGYAYAYPHKTFYRRLEKPIALSDAWKHEDKHSLFLYIHLPFCEMRCGFCNLFTTVRPADNFVSETLASIARQSQVVANALNVTGISQIAFGGGTPSYLSTEEMHTLFANLEQHWPIDWQAIGSSFEISPATIDAEKLALLKAHGVKRLSMGVQSFDKHDLKLLGRPQKKDVVMNAVESIKQADLPIFNIDLIFGIEGQTLASWMRTIEHTLTIAPEEIYLYPLYVRDLTGLGRTGKTPSQKRRELYLAARDKLVDNGYTQVSLRMFRKHDEPLESDYSCQDDGMIGLGPGARSYTRTLHYSSDFAVRQPGIKGIINEFNTRTDEQHAQADYGAKLNLEEQKRRFIIKSLLHVSGLDHAAYRHQFNISAINDFPQLNELDELGLCNRDGEIQHLNAQGLSWSDEIGPWLYSDDVVEKMQAFDLK